MHVARDRFALCAAPALPAASGKVGLQLPADLRYAVNRRMTLKRRTGEGLVRMLDTEEMNRWRRLTAAMLSHAAQDDPAAFAQVVKVLNDAIDQLPAVCDRMRHQTGSSVAGDDPVYSWADVARELGVSRQAAFKRYRFWNRAS